MHDVRMRFSLWAMTLLSVAVGCSGNTGSGDNGGGSGNQVTKRGDLLVVEPGSGSILAVNPDGDVYTVLSASEIRSVTGAATVNLDRKGIAVDPRNGTAYFSEQESGALLELPVGGPLSILAARDAFVMEAGATNHFNLGIAL